MKIFRSKAFKSDSDLEKFVNQMGIVKEDIVMITATEYWITLYYYSAT